MMNLNAFTMKKVLVHERGQIKEMILLYTAKYAAIETRTCKVT